MENKDKDCPLCGKHKAIKYVPLKKHTISRPAPKKTIGNYSFKFTGGEYEYSHADECSELRNATYKKDLLRYHVEGESLSIFTKDLLDFEDYNKTFLKKGFTIKSRGANESGRDGRTIFKTEFYVQCKDNKEKIYLITKSANPNKAFDLLRHRLLCGEVFAGYQLRGVEARKISLHKV